MCVLCRWAEHVSGIIQFILLGRSKPLLIPSQVLPASADVPSFESFLKASVRKATVASGPRVIRWSSANSREQASVRAAMSSNCHPSHAPVATESRYATSTKSMMLSTGAVLEQAAPSVSEIWPESRYGFSSLSYTGITPFHHHQRAVDQI